MADFIDDLRDIKGTRAGGAQPSETKTFEDGIYGHILYIHDDVGTNTTSVQDNTDTVQALHDTVTAKEALVNPHYAAIDAIADSIENHNFNEVGDNIAKVVTVADDLLETISEIETVADDLNETVSEIEVVAGDTVAINEIYNNRLEIYAADENASIATEQAGIATEQAIISTNQAGIASTQAAEADISADEAQLRAWEAEASRLTSDSFATEDEDVFTKIYTSAGDGTFTSVDTTEYSAYHWKTKAAVYADDLAIAELTITNKTLNDYSNFIHADALHQRVKATEAIVKGQILRYVAYNAGEDAVEVALADNTIGVSFGIAEEGMAVGEFGTMIITGVLDNVNTDSWNEGTILYADGAGTLTDVEPTTGFAQPCAFVMKKNSQTGVLRCNFDYPKQDGSDVRFTPVGDLSSTNVQNALEELDSEKSSISHNHDSVYYTETETDTLLSGKSDVHSHPYASDMHTHAGTYEPADATILKDADIGVTVLAPNGDGSQLTGITAGLEDSGHSFATNGYQKLSNGLIIQWYQATSSAEIFTALHPITFPTACLTAQVTGGSTNFDTWNWRLRYVSTTGVTVKAHSTAKPLWILAIGY
jgi:hypothetical protein